MKTLQISTASTAKFLSNSCFKNGTQKQKFPIWKILIEETSSLSNRTIKMLQLTELGDIVKFLSPNTPDFISLLLWPPNSPDLNPVDYEVWCMLQQRVYNSRIRDVDHALETASHRGVALLRPEHHWPSSSTVACSCPCKRRPLWAHTVTDVFFVYELLRRLSILETSVFEFHF